MATVSQTPRRKRCRAGTLCNLRVAVRPCDCLPCPPGTGVGRVIRPDRRSPPCTGWVQTSQIRSKSQQDTSQSTVGHFEHRYPRNRPPGPRYKQRGTPSRWLAVQDPWPFRKAQGASVPEGRGDGSSTIRPRRRWSSRARTGQRCRGTPCGLLARHSHYPPAARPEAMAL